MPGLLNHGNCEIVNLWVFFLSEAKGILEAIGMEERVDSRDVMERKSPQFGV